MACIMPVPTFALAGQTADGSFKYGYYIFRVQERKWRHLGVFQVISDIGNSDRFRQSELGSIDMACHWIGVGNGEIRPSVT